MSSATNSAMRDSAQDFSRKLRLAMRVARCVTQKEMHARIKLLNPETRYEPTRAYKWAQGRSMPRDPSVYDDIARLLDLSISGGVLRLCSYEEYRRHVEARHGAGIPEPAPTAEPSQPQSQPMPAYMAGSYLTLSRAWSIHRATGWLIAGAMTFRPAHDGLWTMDYIERLPGGELKVGGPVHRLGRCLYALLTNSEQEIMLSTTYTLPTAPAPILSGVMSGVSLHDPEMRPAACRIIAIRAPTETEGLPECTGYVEAADGAIADCLAAVGLARSLADKMAPGVLAFATGSGDEGLIHAPSSSVNSLIGLMLAEAA
ncbi:MAG: hypothetical protein P1U88_23290 [Thalassobaculaceae bacterium]|nr:hypothetical protein [Thalassobaculaceae bacterium]